MFIKTMKLQNSIWHTCTYIKQDSSHSYLYSHIIYLTNHKSIVRKQIFSFEDLLYIM